MNNMPKEKIGIVAVSRDCFPMSLSENRRKAVVKSYQENTVRSMNVPFVWKMSLI